MRCVGAKKLEIIMMLLPEVTDLRFHIALASLVD